MRQWRGLLEAAPVAERTGGVPRRRSGALARCARGRSRRFGGRTTALRELAALEVLLDDLLELLRGYAELAAGARGDLAARARRRIVLATHMHAGDGNVHVNIPVMSNDRAMMQRAEGVVDA